MQWRSSLLSNVPQCILVVDKRHCKKTCRFHLQGRNSNRRRGLKGCLETSVINYQIRQRNITERRKASAAFFRTNIYCSLLVSCPFCIFYGVELTTSTINQQMHLYNFHLKHFKTLETTPTYFDLKRSKYVGVVLSVLSESYIGEFVG